MGVMDVPRLSEEEERELRGVLPVNVYGDHPAMEWIISFIYINIYTF